MKSSRFTVYCLIFSVVFLSGLLVKDLKSMCIRTMDISGGEDHTMVLTENGLVFTCGLDQNSDYYYYGTLGIGTFTGSYKDTLVQVLDGRMETSSGYLENIAGIAAGWTHSLAQEEDGYVWSWGGNLYGQLGVGKEPPYSRSALQVLSGEQNTTGDPNAQLFLEDIVNIAAGRSGNHSLAVDKYGLTWSWGINYNGQLGCGDTTNRYVPVAVYAGEQNPTEDPNQLSHIIEVSAGAYFSMALEDPNQGAGVYTFGCNYSNFGGGMLGVGKDEYELFQVTEPVKVLSGVQDPENEDTYLQNIVAISAGWHHSMALEKLDDNDPNAKGRVYTWGWNGLGYKVYPPNGPFCQGGRLGNDDYYEYPYYDPADVRALTPILVKSGEQNPYHEDTYLENIVAIAAGESHSIALDKDGFVYTWGDNLYGQLGIGEGGDYTFVEPEVTPVKVRGGEMGTEYLQDIVAISAGYWNCLAVDKEGVLWSWGLGKEGRLGTDDTAHENLPRRIGIIDTDENDTHTDDLCPRDSEDLYVIKIDDPNEYSACGVKPGDTITYSINFNPTGEERNFVYVIDYLPPEAEFVSADPNTGSHDILNHLYRWNFLTTPLDTDDKFTLTVRVTEAARPYGTITNMVEVQLLIHPEYYYWDTHATDVCCWGGPILYVDENANNNGYETGQSWQHAFTDLQDALQLAQDCSDNIQEIWVANGTYSPGADTSDAFVLIDGVAIYGGFAGNETSREQRNWSTNKTILTGYGNCEAVVTAGAEINSVVLDGFIIEAAEEYGIQCIDCYLHIANCLIHHNGDYGIHCKSSDPNISYCTASYQQHGIYCDQSGPMITNCLLEHNNNGIYCDESDPNVICSILRDNGIDGLFAYNTSSPLLYECLIEANGSDGIECQGSNSYLIVSNSKIRANADHGIYVFQATADITNNWIHHNQQNGIKLTYAAANTNIRNNTIVYNTDYGIENSSGNSPTVKNNILWGNTTEVYGSISPTYSCIEGVTVPNNDHNINNDPEFAYRDPDSYNFHLDPNSACIDAGDTMGIDENETDIDGDPRIIDPNVDIGADELDCTDVSNAADFNGDGIVNLFDYTPLAAYWLTDDSDPNWPDQYDLIDDGEINLLDLQVFCDNWLWQACYYDNDWYGMEMAMSGGSGSDIGFGKSSAMQSLSIMAASAKAQPQPIIITEKELWELIYWLEDLWENEPEIYKIYTEEEWKEFMDRVYMTFDYLDK